MARMDRLRVGPTVSKLRSQLRNWYVVGPAAYLVMLSPLRHALERSALARSVLTLRFRDGRTLRLQINDMQVYVEIFILDDYDIPDARWEDARVVVDAGANVGAATLWFATRCPQARILAIEPGAHTREVLRQNLAANGLNDRVEVIAAALGGEPGTAYLQTGGPSVLNHLTADTSDGEPVEMTTVDAIVRDHNLDSIDFFKLDCEGSEFEILLGDTDGWLPRVRTMVGEWHPSTSHTPEEIAGKLRDSGFDVEMEPHPTLAGFGNFTARRRAP